MTDEVFTLMTCFPESKITPYGEVILDCKNTMCFRVKGLETKEQIIYKLLEWCSRPIAKGEPYVRGKSNEAWRKVYLDCLNKYLSTNFSTDDIYWIYDKLGNAVDHDRTVRFVNSGFDMKIIMED